MMIRKYWTCLVEENIQKIFLLTMLRKYRPRVRRVHLYIHLKSSWIENESKGIFARIEERDSNFQFNFEILNKLIKI